MSAHFLLRPLSVLGPVSLAGMAAWRLCGCFGSGNHVRASENQLTVDYYVRNIRYVTSLTCTLQARMRVGHTS